jgi:hypothetical protein
MDTQRFELLVSIPWGNKEGEISPAFFCYPNFNDILPEQRRRVYAPHRFSLDVKRGVHVLSNDKCNLLGEIDGNIVHFSPSGDFSGKTSIPKDLDDFKYRQIADFSVDADENCFLLEHFGIDNYSYQRLLKMDREGNVIWQINELASKGVFDCHKIEGDLEKVLIDRESNLYLTFTSRKDVLARVNSETGEIMEMIRVENAGNNVFINEDGSIMSVVYFEKQRRRGLSMLSPSSRVEKFTIGGSELFGLLLFPFGTDNHLNCYIYKVPNVYEHPAVVKISFAGHVVDQQNIKDIAVRSGDNAIFTGCSDDSNMVIFGYFQDGSIRRRVIEFPDVYSSLRASNRKLINVDDSDKYYISAGEQPGDIDVLLVFSEDGELLEEIRHPEDLLGIESTLQPYSYWKVDGDGNIYLPITDPGGFKIVRLDSIGEGKKTSGGHPTPA